MDLVECSGNDRLKSQGIVPRIYRFPLYIISLQGTSIVIYYYRRSSLLILSTIMMEAMIPRNLDYYMCILHSTVVKT
jgi:hypothetical protein